MQSLGARFVELPLESADSEDKGGYAKAQDESFYRRQREMMIKVVAASDVVITTALIPGKRAPILLTTEMVEAMQPGSVVVDLAAERGGNCELTRPDETVVHKGVTIIGPSNPAALVPYHASQMYSKNITTFLMHLLGKDGAAQPSLPINPDDEITRETLLTHQRRRRARPGARAAWRSSRRLHAVTIWIIETRGDAELPFTFRILPGKVKTIGRAAGADFIVDAGMVRACTAGSRPARRRSRSTDLDSTNGTYVNGLRVEHALLKDGDQLGVGRVTFEVCRVES